MVLGRWRVFVKSSVQLPGMTEDRRNVLGADAVEVQLHLLPGAGVPVSAARPGGGSAAAT